MMLRGSWELGSAVLYDHAAHVCYLPAGVLPLTINAKAMHSCGSITLHVFLVGIKRDTIMVTTPSEASKQNSMGHPSRSLP